jgi:hypothetical protein
MGISWISWMCFNYDYVILCEFDEWLCVRTCQTRRRCPCRVRHPIGGWSSYCVTFSSFHCSSSTFRTPMSLGTKKNTRPKRWLGAGPTSEIWYEEMMRNVQWPKEFLITVIRIARKTLLSSELTELRPSVGCRRLICEKRKTKR